MAVAAIALLVALAALVVTDAGSATELAWLGAGFAAVLLVAGMVAGSLAAVHAGIVVLGTIFLLRQDSRMLLAPLYGAGLLLVADLCAQTIELSELIQVAPEVVGARTGAALVAATIGACVAAAAALAQTAAPGRSVALTALGALALVGALAMIVWSARRRYGASASE